MLQLIKRCPEYTLGYKEYCQELYDNNIIYFRPTNPKSIDEDWFARTKSWYDKKEKGLIEGQPISFHYWAVDDGKFIGEFQLRTEFPEKSDVRHRKYWLCSKSVRMGKGIRNRNSSSRTGDCKRTWNGKGTIHN